MKTLVISDVHGNLPALEFVLKKHKDAELVISLGDVVNYGPWSNECVDILESLDSKITILGNHEQNFNDGSYPGSNLVAKTFFDFCYPLFERNSVIEKYIPNYIQDKCEFVHTVHDTYVFPDTTVTINTDTFIGHSHRLFTKLLDGNRLVNVGSVGQNRLNIDEVNYVLWNSDDNSVELMRDSFSADLLIKEMMNKKYPKICMDYILSKRLSNGE